MDALRDKIALAASPLFVRAKSLVGNHGDEQCGEQAERCHGGWEPRRGQQQERRAGEDEFYRRDESDGEPEKRQRQTG